MPVPIRERTAVDHPRFRLRWLLDRRSPSPDWLIGDEWLPSGDRTLFARAKQALHAALAAHDGEGVVLVPAYVPGGVVWAALRAGYDVRYYPVNADLSLPADTIVELIESHDPAAVVFVQYFGFVDESFSELAEVADNAGALVIEDCARGLFGRDRDGNLLGSTGDVALYCLHKTLPVPNGGLVVTDGLTIPEPEMARSEWRTVPQVAALSLAQLGHVPVDPTPTVSRPDSRPVSSASPPERASRPGELTTRGLARCRPNSIQSAREGRYRALSALLREQTDLTVVSPPVYEGASPFGVAALARSESDRSRYLRTLRSHGLPCEVLTWPPIHRRDEVYGFEGAKTLRERLLVIPTHQQLDPEAVGLMASILSSESEST